MKIGIDVDGVLADFVRAYQPLFVSVTGRDLFHPGDIDNPPVWEWPTLRGYLHEETREVWNVILKDETFWFNLQPFAENCMAIMEFFHTGQADLHDVYFITSRPGVDTKFQTEQWLMTHPRVIDSTVLIAAHRTKGILAKALQLDCYIDDNYDNCVDVVRESPTTRCYLLHRSYNNGTDINRVLDVERRRVPSVLQFLLKEGLIA